MLCSFYLLVAPLVIIAGGIVIVIGVLGILAARQAIKITTGKIKREYQNDPETAATMYGFPTYKAWLASQSFIVRWFAA